MTLIRGTIYTREDVHHHVGGGSQQAYLLSVGGRIVAACLNPDMNPDAPRVILVGKGVQVQNRARQLAKQSEPIEVFLKHVSGERDASHNPLNWEYWGSFVRSKVITDEAQKHEYQVRANRKELSCVIILRPAVSGTTVQQEEEFREGACQQVTREQRERNIAAREACIAIYGYKCEACDLLFVDRYGEVGREFIHVHHRDGLANKVGERIVNPRTDLVPVCPNCHAMLHRRSPNPYSIDEVRSMIATHSKPPRN